MPLDLCSEGSRELLERHICLSALSKNLKGVLTPLEHETERCTKLKCVTLKTIHFLKVQVVHHQCDSATAQVLDGWFSIRNLVSAYEGGDGRRRGIHEGEFVWKGSGAVAFGTISGITNAGTHRRPYFDPCQTCNAKGFMEGRFCGTIRKAQRKQLVGCQVVGTYRLRFHPTKAEGGSGPIDGSLEGDIVCACPD